MIPFFICVLFSSVLYVEAQELMSIADYSYDKVYKALPEENQTNTYVYESSDDVGLVALATYNGSDYKTSIKHKKNATQFLYCIDRNNSIEFTDQYVLRLNFFNDELRTRLGIALYNGPKNWGGMAAADYTTGNSILDYYMTQIVVHALIYDYGGTQSNLGIDFSKISFKDNTGKLKKNTTALYNYCCSAKITYKDGYFQSTEFTFVEPTDNNLYLEENYLVSSTVECEVSDDIAEVAEYTREGKGFIDNDAFDSVFIGGNAPFSDFSIKIPIDEEIKQLAPGIYPYTVFEEVIFQRAFAGLYICGQIEFTDTSQELGTLLYDKFIDADEVGFQFLVGGVHLYKTDSVTGEHITDANFEIQEYNSTTGTFESYCTMEYNADKQRYESNNLYLSVHNKDGRFRVVETSAGANYRLDWEGAEFQITQDCYLQEFHVENPPVLGSLSIKKLGERWSYTEQGFSTNSKVALPDVSFALYAGEDIYIKKHIQYTKDQKIVDMVTDGNGQIKVTDLPMGEYYVVETITLDDYILDSTKHYFTISRDATRKYSEVSLSVVNHLKHSDISILKCYYEDDDVEQKNPIPLENALFGLYLKEDLCDIYGNVILHKDSCVDKQYSDKDGMIYFSDLPYVEYYVKELQAPDGFVINDGIITFTLEDFEYDSAKRSYITNRQIINERQRFSLEIDKTGEEFTGAWQVNSEYGAYYQYVIGDAPLKDVTFSLYDCHKKLIATKCTDSSGKVQFDNLITGTYYVAESAAPEQYHFFEEPKEVILAQDNKDYSIFQPTIFSQSYYNELCDCTITLLKSGEHAVVTSKGMEYEYVPLENVVFGIYQNFDYTFSGSGDSLMKGNCVGYIVTEEDGTGVFSGTLPCGEYYVKELATLPGYELDEEEHYFTILPNHNENITVSLATKESPLINQLSKASVKICKTDADTGKSLKGVEFTLYNSQEQKIGVYKTNRKGEITVKNLPYGEYYFVETKCKKGYYSTNNKYYFELNSEEMITLDITNSPIVKLGVHEQYNVALISTVLVLFVFMIVVTTNLWFLYHNKKTYDE